MFRWSIWILLITLSITAIAKTTEQPIYSSNQTSASLLVLHSESQMRAASAEQKNYYEKKHLLVFDIYIKARSYAILNKVFFVLSLFFGFAVLIWPSISVIFNKKLENFEWIKSATVQTTVTGLAALMFTFYSQYKDKQVYAESLMRYVVYSNASVEDLATKVSEELMKIDRGFSFNSIVNGGQDSSGN
jgi:hypothetical protein